MRRFLTVIAVIFIIVVSAFGGAKLFPTIKFKTPEKEIYREVLNEESAVISVVDAVTPSVVTISIKKTQKTVDPLLFFFNPQINEKLIEEDIGSGFIISSQEGLVITNRHVVDDLEAEYKIITADNTELAAEKIYRDPINDMAIIKVSPSTNSGLKPVKLGDSDRLKVGQTVIAIGTALGEFRSTVTTGVISGLGRGIDAGSPWGGLSERLDNVIQTDAAINPGNSGGPLLNSSGEVIGVNVAVSQAGQNISFAIPINIVKEAINTFEATGKFSRPYLGVRYQMLTAKTALLNNVPQGAYVVELVKDSPAEKGGLKAGDIVMQIDELKLDENNGIAEVIAKKKVGDEIKLKVYRDNQGITIEVKLEEVGG
ncbi:trypsin-like peptidase domain-containing protein [Patescibacteria group bacterium]|nr:trypsin-like peptidase domain-containing protein [Patescibacteria group bacterium]MBU1499591.1 trypsin-like peptidase domain-containing protein [Patescibacteria group bacterium]